MAEVGEARAAENVPAGRYSASSADEESAVSGSAAAGVPRAREPKGLQPILRTMAETHRDVGKTRRIDEAEAWIGDVAA